MPDEVQRAAFRFDPSQKTKVIDIADDLMFVRRYYPSVLDPESGDPRTWREYQLALAHGTREQARQNIQSARSVAMGMSGGDKKDEWLDEQLRIAGWK